MMKLDECWAAGLKLEIFKSLIGAGPILRALRGGNWNNTSNAGVFYLNLNNARSNANNNIGFRST